MEGNSQNNYLRIFLALVKCFFPLKVVNTSHYLQYNLLILSTLFGIVNLHFKMLVHFEDDETNQTVNLLIMREICIYYCSSR